MLHHVGEAEEKDREEIKTEGDTPLFHVLGSSFVPEMPEPFSFAAYKGSMTVPPCTENVQWVVLQKPISASVEQINAIDKLHNVKLSRALTPLHGRPISHGWFHSSNIKTAMARKVIQEPWFGVNPANMVVPQVRKIKQEVMAEKQANKK